MLAKYEKAIEELATTGITQMRVHGNSMTPIIESGSMLTFLKCADYNVGDVVMCRVRGRIIDAHKITSKNSQRGWLISNNHGHDNGWSKKIFGKVVMINGVTYH